MNQEPGEGDGGGRRNDHMATRVMLYMCLCIFINYVHELC